MHLARLGILPRWSWLLAALALTACSSSTADPPAGRDAGALSDAAPAPGSDAGAPAVETGPLCYDGLDNDFDGATDCEDDGCHEEVVCCVASERAECCDESGRTVELSITCDGSAESCLGGDALLFGDATPTIEGGAIVPQGGPGHGGVVVGQAIDPRSANVTFEATIEVPASRCTGDCVDAAGIALLDAIPQDGAPASVRFGILVSGSRNEVVVLFADEPIARRPITTGTSSYRIEIDVAGNARALAGTDELARVGDLELPPQAYLAIFGRTQNRGPGQDAIRARSAAVTTYACDAPSALARSAAPVVPWSGATWEPREVRRPSVVAYASSTGPRVRMAFAHEGQIHLAERTGFGEFRNAAFDPGPPALELPDRLASARDPWLVAHEGRLVLLFVGVDQEGATSIWRSTGGPDYADVFTPPLEVFEPTLHGLSGIDGPAVITDHERWTMVARVHQGQEHRLMQLTSHDAGASWVLGAPLRAPQPDDLFAFDRDEVASPALIVLPDERGRPIQRLYYAGRRGTVWRIGLLASSDGHLWRSVGPVLEPDDGFDSLGVMEPAPLFEEGVLRLYYTGTDGTRFRIGVSGPAGTMGE